MALSVSTDDLLLPWTESTLDQATKKQLVKFLQANASDDFLGRHSLNGRRDAIAKRAKLSSLCAAYREVLCDPLATLTRSKLAIAAAIFEACCVHSGAVAHIVMHRPDYDATKAEIQSLHAEITHGAIDFTEAARRHSICPSAQCGGLLGRFVQGRIESAQGDVPSFARPPSKVRLFGPIRTKCGFQLVQVSQYLG